MDCLANFLANYNDKKGVLLYSESYLVECMFIKTNTKSLLNLPAVADAKPSHAESKGLDCVLQPVPLMHCCHVPSLQVIRVQVNVLKKHLEY